LILPATRGRPLALASVLVVTFVAGRAKADADVHPADGDLVIVSDSDCPSGEAVRDALLALRPAGEWPALSVAIREFPQMLVIEIGSQKTNPRQLAVGPDCATRAAAVALVITAWTGDLPVEAAGTPVLQPPAVVVQPPGMKPEEVIRKTGARHTEIGAGLLAATADGIVPGIRLEFGRMGARQRPGLAGRRYGFCSSRGNSWRRHNPLDAAFRRGWPCRSLGDAKAIPRRAGGWGGGVDLCLGLRLCGKPVRLVADLGSRRGHARGCALGPNPTLDRHTRRQMAARTERRNRSSRNWQVGDGEVAILDFQGAIGISYVSQ